MDEFWAGYFGCRPENLGEAKTLVVPHAALRDYEGVLAFRHGEACIVSVPATVPEVERRTLRGAPPERAFDPRVLARSFVVGEECVSPTAWVGVCEPEDFRPAPSSARPLTIDDFDGVCRLAEACGERFGVDRDPMFGRFVGAELVAVSTYVGMGELAYVGIVTHPRHRGRGHGKAVASAAMEHAFGRGLIPMWRTVASNGPAIAVARSLGFRPYALTMEVQLTADPF